MLNVGDEGEDKAQGGARPIEQVSEAPQKDDASAPEIKSTVARRAGAFGVLVLMATILAVAGTGILYLISASKTANVEGRQKEFNQLNQQLTTGELAQLDKDVLEVMAGATALDTALNTRIYWSKFWSQLNGVTPKSVAYSSMTVDKEGTIAISGKAADFTSVAKLMVSLQKAPVFSMVELGGTSLKEEGDKKTTLFSLKLKVNPELLLNK